ncbi:CLUMA_CG013411, isoform A [Clunio marinus]|uniref:CLUMA_CG013411, isoform A n=1 Tax=Clunio marinus TaxID=568069 RepID=A0A1J1IIS2_9DIPT|nr:CLUMA_CG013411, isoform A [Clunio marinus]
MNLPPHLHDFKTVRSQNSEESSTLDLISWLNRTYNCTSLIVLITNLVPVLTSASCVLIMKLDSDS